jgi:hypothetical protein
MIKNAALVREFERARVRTEKPDFRRALKIVEALRKEAALLGRSSGRDPLDGINHKIRVAKALNHVRTTPRQDRRRAR